MSIGQRLKQTAIASAVALGLSGTASADPDRPLDMLEFHGVVHGTPDEVWQAWTTVEGLQSFFGPEVIFEPKPMGNFAIHWGPDNPPGTKGAEDLHILSYEPEHKRLAFTWSAPPQWERVRPLRAMAEIRIADNGNGTSLVSLYHYGWGPGEDWAEVRDYFSEAWKTILARLQYRFETGPFDWEEWRRDLTFTPAEFKRTGDAASRL